MVTGTRVVAATHPHRAAGAVQDDEQQRRYEDREHAASIDPQALRVNAELSGS